MSDRKYFTSELAKNTLDTVPVGQVNIGEIFSVECINGFGRDFNDEVMFENFMNSPEKTQKNHPCTGPIEINGIDDNYSLAVKILNIEISKTYSCISKSTGLLKDVYKDRSVTIYNNESEKLKLADNYYIAGNPSIGFAATINSIQLKGGRASNNGGNLDMPYLKAGAIIYLPVNYDKALLGVGDVHFSQGLGELSGMALESDAVLTLQVFKAEKRNYPIIETLDEIIVIGTGDSEDVARKKALNHTLDFLKCQTNSESTADDKIYQLLGGIGDMVTGNMCGKTPTVGIVIKKNAVTDHYGLSQIKAPRIIFDRHNDIETIFSNAIEEYENLPILHNGDSRQIRIIEGTDYGIMKFNPLIYSFKAHGAVLAPDTEKPRVKINQFIADYLRENGVMSSTLVSKDEYALVTVEDATANIEVVIKEAFSGSPKHIYKNLPQALTRFDNYLEIGSKHQPYVRFDWRLPHPDDDTLMPEDLADYFINTQVAKHTALTTYRLVKKLLNEYDLDISDMCLFMNKNGDKVLAEISPDNMGSLTYIGNVVAYKEIFANRDKENTLTKWSLTANLLGLEE